jgi:hypothetical protein
LAESDSLRKESRKNGKSKPTENVTFDGFRSPLEHGRSLVEIIFRNPIDI